MACGKFRFLAPLAGLAFLFATPAQAAQDFESYPNGTATPWLHDGDPLFGYFDGGTVEQPGVTVDAAYTLGGERVYFGSSLRYTNILPGPYHCCGYGRMEMLVSSLNGVTIEFYGHLNPDGESPEFFTEVLMASLTVFGLNQHVGWGAPLDGPEGLPGNFDITSIRWISLDGTPVAIDNVIGVGMGYVPEPASWALLIAGFGLVGARLRRQPAALA